MELPPELDGVLEEVADRHGTPAYVTSLETVRRRYEELRETLPVDRVQYAAKANTNPRVLETIAELDGALDAVSHGEVEAALRAGFDADDVMYTGVNPSDDEIRSVAEAGATVNADCMSVVDRLADHHDGEMGVRVNPDVGAGHHDKVVTGGEGSKFGVPQDSVEQVFDQAASLGLEPVGLHAHVGSGVLDHEELLEAAEAVFSIARRLEANGRALDYVDVGGGLGVPYRPGDHRLDIEAYAAGLEDAYDLDADLVVEPGRYVVAESTVLLTRVTTRKPGFAGVDAGMNTLLRPALYDSYHHVSNLSRSAPVERVDVVGPICESGDVLAEDRELPAREGDLLAVHTAGAYGAVMASRYNSRGLPAEVVVDGEDVEVVRERETPGDFLL
ncbi:MAG: diaminopimelate decarboxylase [Halobacteriota archaeon]